MSDKEVGKMWRYYRQYNINGAPTILGLIQKLVVAEVEHLQRFKEHDFYPPSFQPLETVLARYDIPAAEWEHPNG